MDARSASDAMHPNWLVHAAWAVVDLGAATYSTVALYVAMS